MACAAITLRHCARSMLAPPTDRGAPVRNATSIASRIRGSPARPGSIILATALTIVAAPPLFPPERAVWGFRPLVDIQSSVPKPTSTTRLFCWATVSRIPFSAAVETREPTTWGQIWTRSTDICRLAAVPGTGTEKTPVRRCFSCARSAVSRQTVSGKPIPNTWIDAPSGMSMCAIAAMYSAKYCGEVKNSSPVARTARPEAASSASGPARKRTPSAVTGITSRRRIVLSPKSTRPSRQRREGRKSSRCKTVLRGDHGARQFYVAVAEVDCAGEGSVGLVSHLE